MLSQQLNIPCFKKDTIKEAMADGFGVGNEEVRDKGSAATFKVMHHIAECFSQVGKTCILEANFRLSEGDEIKLLLEKYNAKCLTFLFTGDLNILFDRYRNREDAGERHWIHLDSGERHDFVNGHLHHKMGKLEVGQVINVDAVDFEKVDYNYLIESAKKFLE
jgi:hypothetical protein